MWLYAASCGSALQGGVSMLVWCLGTLPAMAVFSILGKTLPAKVLRIFQRFTVVMMLAAGIAMAIRGIGMA